MMAALNCPADLDSAFVILISQEKTIRYAQNQIQEG